LELKLKGKRHTGNLRTGGFREEQEDIQKRGKSDTKLKMKDCGEKEETGEISSIDLYKTETILQDDTDLVHEKKILYF
jgi:hypothetical protein